MFGTGIVFYGFFFCSCPFSYVYSNVSWGYRSCWSQGGIWLPSCPLSIYWDSAQGIPLELPHEWISLLGEFYTSSSICIIQMELEGFFAHFPMSQSPDSWFWCITGSISSGQDIDKKFGWSVFNSSTFWSQPWMLCDFISYIILVNILLDF